MLTAPRVAANRSGKPSPEAAKSPKVGPSLSWGEKKVHYGKAIALSGFVVAGYAFSWWVPITLGSALVVGGCVAVRFVPHRVHSRR